MADKYVDLEATDRFDLGGLFVAQTSSLSSDLSHAKMKKANGDYQKFSDTFNITETVNVSYEYNADSGLSNDLPFIGSIQNGWSITSINVETATGEYPKINIEGHNHSVNPHDAVNQLNQYGVTLVIDGALGADDFAGLAVTALADACIQSSSYTLSVNHVDAECGGGDHFVGQQIEGMEAITCNYIGLIGDKTLIGWTVTNYGDDDSNADFDTSTISMERLNDRIVVVP